MNRRQFLQTLGGAAAAATVSQSAQAQTEAYAAKPDHVTLTGYDEIPAEIEQYQPRTVTRTLDITPSAAYAWRATSPEYEYDWYCYWYWYPAGQTGLSEADSHVPDREPVYVAVDASGDVRRVLYDQTHYLVGRADAPTLDADHSLLHIVNPWHQFQPTTEAGVLADLGDMHDKFGPWLDAGWSVDEASVLNPPHVQSRGHWWPTLVAGFSLTATLTRTILDINETTGLSLPIIGRDT